MPLSLVDDVGSAGVSKARHMRLDGEQAAASLKMSRTSGGDWKAGAVHTTPPRDLSLGGTRGPQPGRQPGWQPGQQHSLAP
eukprot:473547-Prymnesium_polylepis.1